MTWPPGIFFPKKNNFFNEIRCILRRFVKFHAEPVCIQLDMTGQNWNIEMKVFCDPLKKSLPSPVPPCSQCLSCLKWKSRHVGIWKYEYCFVPPNDTDATIFGHLAHGLLQCQNLYIKVYLLWSIINQVSNANILCVQTILYLVQNNTKQRFLVFKTHSLYHHELIFCKRVSLQKPRH